MLNQNVVIVDDNEADLFFTAMLLRQEGFTKVEEFHSGQDMLAAYENGLPCDIVFMDVRMPHMDGFATVNALAKTERWNVHQPTVYMISAAANPEDRERADENDAIRDMARKPLSADRLAGLLRSAV